MRHGSRLTSARGGIRRSRPIGLSEDPSLALPARGGRFAGWYGAERPIMRIGRVGRIGSGIRHGDRASGRISWVRFVTAGLGRAEPSGECE